MLVLENPPSQTAKFLSQRAGGLADVSPLLLSLFSDEEDFLKDRVKDVHKCSVSASASPSSWEGKEKILSVKVATINQRYGKKGEKKT